MCVVVELSLIGNTTDADEPKEVPAVCSMSTATSLKCAMDHRWTVAVSARCMKNYGKVVVYWIVAASDLSPARSINGFLAAHDPLL